MKLKNLKITNFRCFESLSIDLDEQLTVLVAKNGQGKSSILDAIRIGLWPIISGFDLARNPGNDAENNIKVDDLRVVRSLHNEQISRQLPCKITLESWGANLFGTHVYKQNWQWTRSRESEATRSKTIDDKITNVIKTIASKAQMEMRSPQNYPDTYLPILCYYGTGRLWNQKKLTKANLLSEKQRTDFFMRLFAYRDCLNPASSYKHFADWFTWIFESFREDQIKQAEANLSSPIDSKWQDTILVVQQAINDVLREETGWYDLEYSVSHEKSLILNHAQNGKLKVEQLSDGIRGVLAMVGDIAYRCIKLNPHLGLNAAKESIGIVMIDEVDMHLHPSWQQTILGSLTQAFPNIQFIVTTHSPQVISTVPSHQIRILDGDKVYSAEAGTKGAEASRILKRIFEVDPRPPHDPNTHLLNQYLDLVYADRWHDEEALAKRKQLDAIFEHNEPELTKADLYIENRQWELEIEKNP